MVGSKINVTNCYSTTAYLENRNWCAAIRTRTGDFQSCHLADRRGFANALAADENDVVLAPQEKMCGPLYFLDVLSKAASERLADIRMFPKRCEFAAN